MEVIVNMPAIDAVALLEILSDSKGGHLRARDNQGFHLGDKVWTQSDGEPLGIDPSSLGTTVVAEIEGLDFATLQWPRGPRTDARILVLTRSDGSPEGSKERALWSLWNRMHDEVVESSSDGLNCVVPRSTHSMMSSRPDVVIDAVSRMVAAVRGNRRIGSRCWYSD